MAWTLVTGGAKRLGAAICEELASAGHSIVVHHNKSFKEAEVVVTACKSRGVHAEAIQGDFSTPENVELFIKEYVKRFGDDTQTLVNNVGNYIILPAAQTSVTQWRDVYQTNFFAPLALIEALLPSLKKHQGSIVNVGTTGLCKGAHSNAAAYMATKQSLFFLTQTLAKELAPFQVRVNMVSPGVLDIAVDASSHLQKIPMQRLGSVDEVARVVKFLIESQNGYITGQNIEVAGGFGL